MSTASVRIHVERILVDQEASDDLRAAFSSEGVTVNKELSMDSPAELQLRHLSSNVRVSFIRHDSEIASGYIAIHPDCDDNASHTFTDTLVTNIKNVYVSNPKFVAHFKVEVDNPHPKQKHAEFCEANASQIASGTWGRKSNSPLRSTYKGTGKLVPNGETSPLRERVNPSHPTKTDKTYKFKEEELHGYLKRIVESHM